ncbi:hypothetical protein [Fibrobacter succinogenes]|uniref:hypothetical protein n=1 Tax=Fibrobacter succinogenes TaxID=833 RepID=UPI0013D4DA6D|nr:hypothetical protein [Fibrobacter succinogenes]
MAVAVGVFAAEWTDFAAQPAEVSLGGKSYYEISSAKELAWFSKQVASGKTEINVVLKNDIVLWDSVSGDTNYWNPIGPSDSLAFEGIFDGAGKTISGARSEYSQENVDSVFNGFFRFVGEKGVVKNFTLEKSVLQVEHLGSDTLYSFDQIANMPIFYPVVGNVVGENRGLVDSVRVIDCEAVAIGTFSSRVVNSGSTAASIMVNAYTMYLYVGGVVGHNRGSVTHAYVNGLIVPPHSTMISMYMGGVVGANEGTVSESRVEGDLKDDYPSVMAGICGLNRGTLDHVKMVGDMSTVTGLVAGIVGENRGLVEWAEYTGSLGRAGDGGVTIGGIAAYNLEKISKSYYGVTEGTKTLKLSASLTDPSDMGISPAAYAGGIVAKQSNDGVVEDCGVRASWIILGTKVSNTVGMYTGGLVGADSGSVYNSYAAFSKISEVGNMAPLYNVILGGEHVGNHYDSVMLEKAFPGDTTGLEQSLMKSPRFAWMLNTKYQTVANRKIWCHNGNHPVLALDGRKSTYGIVRYVNDLVLDTVFTDCSGLAVWGDSISDPNTGKKIGNWLLKNGDKTQNVGPQYVFSRDTSIYTSVENADWLLKEKSSSSSLVESSSSSAELGSSSGTISIQVPLVSASLKYSVERGRIYLSGLTFAEPVALFDVQGNLVKREISTGSNLSIALEHRGMYILKYMGTSYRVFVP